MAESVQWIRLKVGMFDGHSFKKIKRAKIGGVSYRDKLTSVWFELLDLAGKGNANGYLVDNNEIPYRSFEDIAFMLDREEKEIELCMQFFINEKMVEIIDDIFCLTNFMQYQNQDGLDKIRAQNRERQARFRESKKEKAKLLDGSNVIDNVTSRNSSYSYSNSASNSSSKNDYALFVDTYNTQCFNLSTVLKVTDKRKKAIANFLKQLNFEDFESACIKANNNPFLTGKNDRGWKADFDFIIKPDNAAKIIEGRYESQSTQTENDKFFDDLRKYREGIL
jgi:predicted phage replisome organizer